METITVAAPKFVSSILKKNGRHMFHVKAVEKYGILEVLSALIPGSQPSATMGHQYSREVEKLLRAEIATVSSEAVDVNTLDYPDYTPQLQNNYTNQTLVKLYLYALDCGLKEDIYLRIFPRTFEVDSKEPHYVPTTAVRPVTRKPAIKRDLAHESKSGFELAWDNVSSSGIIDSLAEYEHFKTDAFLPEFVPGKRYKLVLGDEKYILVRGVNGGIAISALGECMVLDIRGRGITPDQSNWRSAELVIKIRECLLKLEDLELLINVADLRLYGDRVSDSVTVRVLENVLRSYR